jgi:ribosomal protein S18 acetylase RimI-like enzyme
MSSYIVRPIALPEWERYRDLRLRALQDAPDAFATKFADVAYNPDEFWQQRLSNLSHDADFPIFVQYGSQAVGLAWGKIEPLQSHDAHLFHMWVAPEHRQHGVGRMLVDAVVAWAQSHGATTMSLSVACENIAAQRLYISAGFGNIEEPKLMRGRCCSI